MVQILADVGVEFPVILCDGEHQINIGNIEIHPTTDFHNFRTMLKHMTGISYNNLTTYLVESRNSETQPDRRKILVTSKVDFMVLVKEKNAYFLVVLKRSRRERRRRSSNRMCLELSPADLFDYRYESMTTGMDELEMQRANNMNMNNYEVYLDWNTYFPSVTEAYPVVESRALCVVCDRANRRGLKPDFHLCVYDEVVEGFFKSKAGPVSRPRKGCLEN